jgi:hypothetical protein
MRTTISEETVPARACRALWLAVIAAQIDAQDWAWFSMGQPGFRRVCWLSGVEPEAVLDRVRVRRESALAAAGEKGKAERQRCDREWQRKATERDAIPRSRYVPVRIFDPLRA